MRSKKPRTCAAGPREKPRRQGPVGCGRRLGGGSGWHRQRVLEKAGLLDLERGGHEEHDLAALARDDAAHRKAAAVLNPLDRELDRLGRIAAEDEIGVQRMRRAASTVRSAATSDCASTSPPNTRFQPLSGGAAGKRSAPAGSQIHQREKSGDVHCEPPPPKSCGAAQGAASSTSTAREIVQRTKNLAAAAPLWLFEPRVRRRRIHEQLQHGKRRQRPPLDRPSVQLPHDARPGFRFRSGQFIMMGLEAEGSRCCAPIRSPARLTRTNSSSSRSRFPTAR